MVYLHNYVINTYSIFHKLGKVRCYSKVDNFTMALFAYVYVFGQTQNPEWEAAAEGSKFYNMDFAGRQLRFGALHEHFSDNFSEVENYRKLSKKSTFLLIFGDNFDRIYSRFQVYLQTKNHTNAYEFLYSIAQTTCYDINYNNFDTEYLFVRHLIRYGRICQVKNFSFNRSDPITHQRLTAQQKPAANGEISKSNF